VAETETFVEFKVPILLYHHVRGEKSTSRYQVTLPDFKLQMEALHEMGYQTIPLSQFLNALDNGSPLPDNAIIITFDDGHLSVYENAFPIMNSFGFKGVFYIVANRIHDIPDFVNVTNLQEMMGAGWEIGSHSYTHSDLTLNHAIAYQEIARSKVDLEKALQTEVQTFAYPFGAFDTFLGRKVQEYGYQAGMGLGTSQNHTRDMQYYLNRIEIYGDFSLSDFKQIFNDS
jgi:peptidoglycan/xylan/chitin deacetylase (PgdA/CDA1 family)